MKIINEALVNQEDIVKELPKGCNNNLDACQCTGNCETIKFC